MHYLYWPIALLNITASVLMFVSMISPEARHFHWARRIPFAIASSTLAMFAAIQIGAKNPDDWQTLMLGKEIVVSGLAALYVAAEIKKRFGREKIR